ncbi:MAG: hypothetical protein KBD51_00765 [Candidatus Levybacteria bacterium]|nr:hypothetical protein [Candidatus Levybacteria bacterium]
MQKGELGRRMSDFILGKKVEGTVAAVLRNPDPSSQRYIVDTGKNLMDTRVRSYFMMAPLIPVYFPRPPLQRGDVFDARTLSSRPWVDGQKI